MRFCLCVAHSHTHIFMHCYHKVSLFYHTTLTLHTDLVTPK